MSFLQKKVHSLLTVLKMNCEHSTVLHSKSMDTSLNFSEKFRLKFHLIMCKMCQTYAKQIEFISENVKEKNSENEKMNPDAKNRLKQALNSKLKS